MEDDFKQLRETCGAVASALVGKDGLVLQSDFPSSVSTETFGIMSATIVGASITAATELGKHEPSRVVVETRDLKIVIYNSGKRTLLVVAVPKDKDVDDVDTSVKDILAQVREG